MHQLTEQDRNLLMRFSELNKEFAEDHADITLTLFRGNIRIKYTLTTFGHELEVVKYIEDAGPDEGCDEFLSDVVHEECMFRSIMPMAELEDLFKAMSETNK